MVIYSGFSHWKWWFPIAMLVYQRVNMDDITFDIRRFAGVFSSSCLILEYWIDLNWVHSCHFGSTKPCCSTVIVTADAKARLIMWMWTSMGSSSTIWWSEVPKIPASCEKDDVGSICAMQCDSDVISEYFRGFWHYCSDIGLENKCSYLGYDYLSCICIYLLLDAHGHVVYTTSPDRQRALWQEHSNWSSHKHNKHKKPKNKMYIISNII